MTKKHNPNPVDSLVAALIGLQMTLQHARLRLEADTDAEALHDLRVALRRLRSLLAPLRKAIDLGPLYDAARNLAKLTGPARDLEVLAAELERQGFAELARERRAQLRDRHAAVLESVELERLLVLLDAWSEFLREAQREGQLRHFEKIVARRLHKQMARLRDALATEGFDRHRLRLLIKRVRYACEAYPQLCSLDKRGRETLKHTQSALGDWHDHFQWCRRIAREPDLTPLHTTWQQRAEAARRDADRQLQKLTRSLG
ncbi:CHAD domain-containing protein [Pseudomonas subflava]|uniref:CHAD domain-containing protein n=1 Tax=Pseudomonas subflava TaxID=2952933 RepID=UPI00207A110C|nr:CHAD domain-containing protein [Pseudomonas subflava]